MMNIADMYKKQIKEWYTNLPEISSISLNNIKQIIFFLENNIERLNNDMWEKNLKNSLYDDFNIIMNYTSSKVSKVSWNSTKNLSDSDIKKLFSCTEKFKSVFTALTSVEKGLQTMNVVDDVIKFDVSEYGKKMELFQRGRQILKEDSDYITSINELRSYNSKSRMKSLEKYIARETKRKYKQIDVFKDIPSNKFNILQEVISKTYNSSQRFELFDDVNFGDFTLIECRKVFIVLTTIAYAFHLTKKVASLAIKFYVKKDLLYTNKSELIKFISEKTKLDEYKVEKIMAVLTSDFSNNTIPKKFNIFNQPLILFSDMNYLLPSNLMNSLIYESNFIDCINKKFKIYNKQYDKSKKVKETSMISKIELELKDYTNLEFYPRKVIKDDNGNVITDLDLLIKDTNSNFALICQLKYLKKVDYSYYFNTKDLDYGQEQLEKTIINIDKLKAQSGIYFDSYEGCVVAVHYIGNSNVKDNYPIILLKDLNLLVRKNHGDLQKTGQQIKSYSYFKSIPVHDIKILYENVELCGYKFSLIKRQPQ